MMTSQTPPEGEKTTEKTLRESLEAAFEAEEAAASASEADDDELEGLEAAAEGREAETDDESPPEGDETGVDEPATASDEEPPAEASDSDLETPPAGLSPAAREAWADTPEAVKRDIAKREQDFEKGIVQYSQNAKRALQMDQALAPFQQFFAINGGNPATAIRDVLATASILQMGAPQQRAQAAAQLIQQFGVDIGMLDKVLAGQGLPAQPSPQPANPEVAQLQQRIDQLEGRTAQQQKQAMQDELDAFAENKEFFKEVRMDMADLMDAAERHGQKLTLEQAYDRACKINPNVAPVIEARIRKQTAASRRAAASSVSGAPGEGANTQGPPKTTREALERAFDQVGGRV
jgi:hypothetical protein